jgi:hypothetical protein
LDIPAYFTKLYPTMVPKKINSNNAGSGTKPNSKIVTTVRHVTAKAT